MKGHISAGVNFLMLMQGAVKLVLLGSADDIDRARSDQLTFI